MLRLRGDYLAIVTLGFGEIIRLFMLNLGELTNGPRGILQIAQPRLFGLTAETVSGGLLSSQGWIFLLALVSSALIAFVAIRLNDSRLGRAWIAMQEDEDVAQATGVHLVRTKLLAFAIGATFAGLAGQLFAARQINIFPENFSLFVSIDALALIHRRRHWQSCRHRVGARWRSRGCRRCCGAWTNTGSSPSPRCW